MYTHKRTNTPSTYLRWTNDDYVRIGFIVPKAHIVQLLWCCDIDAFLENAYVVRMRYVCISIDFQWK